MQPIEESIVEVPEVREMDGDAILTVEQRKKLYRAKLVSHQAGRGKRLKEFLLARRRYIRMLDQIPRRKRAEDIDLMCRFYNGDQYGRYNEVGMYEDNRQEGDMAYTIPVLSGHVEQAFIQLLKVRPEYNVAANDKNDATMGLVAQMCEDLGVEELKRVMEPVIHSELYNMLLGGENTRFIGWGPDKVNPKTVKRAKHTIQTIDLPARRECAQCKENVAEQETSCPKCGSTEITDIPGGRTRQAVLTGYDEIELGQNTVRLPHMLALQRDMSAVEPDDSTFLVEYSYLDKHIAEWEYQSPVEESNEPLPIEMQLRYDLERGSNQTDAMIGSARLAPPGREGAFGLSAGAQGAMPRGKQPQERHYWDASQYGQFVFQVDETLPDGTVIPKDTIFGDLYPKGAFILFVGDTIMDVKPYVRRRKTTTVRYGRIAGTNSGAGMKKGMPLQNAVNDNFNLQQTVKHTVGHPLTVILGQYVKELPGAGNVLKITNAGLDDVGKAVKQYPGQSMSQGDGSDQVIQGALQFILGTNTVGGSSIAGAPDMRAAGTATGIAAMQEQASARQSGPVDQRISADKEMIIQLLENIQDYSTDEQKQELAKRFGTDVVKAFFSSNLRHCITVGIRPNTDMPRSTALQQANFIAFGQAIGQILPVAQGFPWIMEFLSDFSTSMGFPTSIGEGRNDRREAEYRLNVLADVEKQMMITNPGGASNAIKLAGQMHQKLAQMCAPLIAMDDSDTHPMQLPNEVQAPRILMQVHSAFMDVYKDALFGEQAKSWSNARKLVVIQLWLDHKKAEMSQKLVESQLMGAIQAAMAPPEPPPPPDNSAEIAAAQQAHEKEQQDRELQIRGAEADHEEQTKDDDLHRETIAENLKHDHQLELERLQQEGAARQADIAAKAKAAASKTT